jgi:hypothetical protein
LSTFRPRASRIASAISVVVTDPYRRPSGPACAGIVRNGLVRRVRLRAGALDGLGGGALGRLLGPAGGPRSTPAVAGWASLRGMR